MNRDSGSWEGKFPSEPSQTAHRSRPTLFEAGRLFLLDADKQNHSRQATRSHSASRSRHRLPCLLFRAKADSARESTWYLALTELVPMGKACATIVSILLLSLAFAQTAEDRIDRIASALRSQEFDKALKLLQPALQEFPRNDTLWTMQGVAYARRGQKREALASFRSALKIAPDNIQALQGAAQIEYDAGSRSGIPLLQHLLRLRPADSTSRGMLAVLEYQQGNCAAAVVDFEKAMELFESQVQALHAYATCLVRLKQLDKAADIFERALALNPDDRRERQLLASIQLMAHKPLDAIATLDPLLKPKPEVDALELASTAYEEAHDTTKAVDALRQALLLDPHNLNLYLDFAAISSTHQSFQVGIDIINDGINLQPKAASLYFARGVLFVQLAEYEKAQADFETAYDLDPSQSLSAAAQGLAAVQQNNLDQALAGVQQKLARRPADPILLYLQADVLTQKGAEPGTAEFQAAMRSAKKAVALRPMLGPARGVLAKLYLQSGQYPEAVTQCKKALEIDPKDQAALYHLIQALRKSGKTAELPELLRRLAQLRQDATKEEREQYRYKLVEGDTQPK
jgi:tetratricopeptide (TPR) repeat protein